MNKTFNNLEILNIVTYFNNIITQEQIKSLPTKIRWNLKKNLEKIIPLAKNFEDFKNTLIKEKIQDVFFTDEKSYEFQQEVLDNDGNPIIDQNGKKETKINRKIKQEYINEYNQTVKDLNEKIEEILQEKETLDIATIDLDDFVNSLSYNSVIDFDCINILSFMDNKDNITKEAE